MEQVTDVVGNPTALLLERVFWLGIGVFLSVAIVNSLIRTLKEQKGQSKRIFTSKELKNLAKKALQKNND